MPEIPQKRPPKPRKPRPKVAPKPQVDINVDQAQTNVDQAATNLDAAERQDRAEEASATAGQRREDQFDAQAQTNLDQGATNVDQVATNVANDTAIAALQEVASAAKGVNMLLAANVLRSRRWTKALAFVVLLVVVLGTVAFWRLKVVTDEATRQRHRLVVQTAVLETQAAQVADARAKSCQVSTVRLASIKKELTFLVDYAVGPHNKSPALRKFAADYPAHLNRVIPPVVC